MKLLIYLVLLFSNLYSNPYSESTISLEVYGDTTKLKITIPKGYHQTLQEDYLYLAADSSKLTLSNPIYYNDTVVDNQREFRDSILITRVIESNNLTVDDSVDFEISYQFCTETGICLFPEVVNKKLFIKKPNNIISTTSNDFNFSILIKFLLFAFLGGVILNLMPCVLPVLSIKALSLVKQSNMDKKLILKHSFAYTIGILLSFWVLALSVILLKLSGESVGWGFQFQSPSFVFALLIIILIFALSMFDIIIFQPPIASTKLANKKGFIGSLFSGVFAVLLATPCTAPMLGPAIGFAFSQPSILIFTIFSLVGLGLATPFLLLGFFPKFINKLPKPGDWMNNFKFTMGFLLLATVLFLYRSLFFLIGSKNSINILWYLLIISFLTWIFGKFYTPINDLKKKTIIFIILLSIGIITGYQLVNFNDEQANKSSTSKYEGWKEFNETEFYNDINNEKKVFVDFTAEWCMTCQTNKLTVLHTEEILSLFKENNIVLYYADNTKRDPILTKWLKKYNRAGVPLYLYFNKDINDVIIFPEVLTKNMIIDKINDSKNIE